MKKVLFLLAVLPMLFSSCQLPEEDAEIKIKKYLSQVTFDFDSNSYYPIRTLINAKNELDIRVISLAKDIYMKYGKGFTGDTDSKSELIRIVNETITNLFWDEDFRSNPLKVIPVYHEYIIREFGENVVKKERFIFCDKDKQIINSYDLDSHNTIGIILWQIELAYIQNKSIYENGGDKEEAIKYVR